MKWIRNCMAVVAMMGLSGSAQAGILDLFNGGLGGHGKSCGCAPTCQPESCKPTITRPCNVSTHTYQRKCSSLKPPCCETSCAPKAGCAPVAKCVKPAPRKCCAPALKCVKPAPRKCCAPAPKCVKPAPPKCCVPVAKACAPAANGCCGVKTVCCDADPCEIAELIYQSQTACYAKDRRKAIHKLGDKFDCVCNPEIMAAMIYALNDADERVRAKAADEIGDQLRKSPCCCSKDVIDALSTALADCDKGVRRQAEQGLEACGYEVVDGSCDTCCDSGGYDGAQPAPASPKGDAAPAPAPPANPKAFFPSRLRQKHASRSKIRNPLADLFGLLD